MVRSYVFFNLHIKQANTIRESAKKTVKSVKLIWDKVCIPTKEENNVIDILINLHKKWLRLKKIKVKVI